MKPIKQVENIMNNIQLKIKLLSVNSEFIGQDAKIVVSGQAKYQFYNNGKMNTRTMAYRAFGKSALALSEAGENSVHVISGQLNIDPPNDQTPNHAMLLTISQSVQVAATQAPVPPQPVAKPQATVQPQSTAQSLSPEESNQIPF